METVETEEALALLIQAATAVESLDPPRAFQEDTPVAYAAKIYEVEKEIILYTEHVINAERSLCESIWRRVQEGKALDAMKVSQAVDDVLNESFFLAIILSLTDRMQEHAACLREVNEAFRNFIDALGQGQSKKCIILMPNDMSIEN